MVQQTKYADVWINKDVLAYVALDNVKFRKTNIKTKLIPQINGEMISSVDQGEAISGVEITCFTTEKLIKLVDEINSRGNDNTIRIDKFLMDGVSLVEQPMFHYQNSVTLVFQGNPIV